MELQDRPGELVEDWHDLVVGEEGEVGVVQGALYCTVLYCTVLYCTVLYCTGGGGAGRGQDLPPVLPPRPPGGGLQQNHRHLLSTERGGQQGDAVPVRRHAPAASLPSNERKIISHHSPGGATTH